MKKTIKQAAKKSTSANKTNTRPFTAKDKGYKEEVYNHEEQMNYQKSKAAKNQTKNTAGPED
ncbi:hypothetical protein [Parafilimonas terrae]|uniref:Uncharacterized protein n=1 Tax=Parafilimonas terrae TaxID=1465490 RepID=A0A1I5ZA99_9BACT|nr:hypothetical protein [Parafilimonas terrae]SFQ53402.1 hypothetical protein SAMN05444277_11842 [Parafilimonas terrae]